MQIADIIYYLLFWGLIGCCLFNVYVVLVFRTGIVYTARHKDGTLKKKASVSGIANSLLLLGCIVGIQVASDYFGLASRRTEISFIGLYLLNYALYNDHGITDGGQRPEAVLAPFASEFASATRPI